VSSNHRDSKEHNEQLQLCRCQCGAWTAHPIFQTFCSVECLRAAPDWRDLQNYLNSVHAETLANWRAARDSK
jgi:hypothetical protein